MASQISRILSSITPPKALQSNVDGGYVLHQTTDAEHGTPVFGTHGIDEVAHIAGSRARSSKGAIKKAAKK